MQSKVERDSLPGSSLHGGNGFENWNQSISVFFSLVRGGVPVVQWGGAVPLVFFLMYINYLLSLIIKFNNISYSIRHLLTYLLDGQCTGSHDFIFGVIFHFPLTFFREGHRPPTVFLCHLIQLFYSF